MKLPRWLKYGSILGFIIILIHIGLFIAAKYCYNSCQSLECNACGVLLLPFLYYVNLLGLNIGQYVQTHIIVGFLIIVLVAFAVGAIIGRIVSLIIKKIHS